MIFFHSTDEVNCLVEVEKLIHVMSQRIGTKSFWSFNVLMSKITSLKKSQFVVVETIDNKKESSRRIELEYHYFTVKVSVTWIP